MDFAGVVRSAVAAVFGAGMPVLTGTAGSATSYADAEGDANTLGHIVSVGAAEGPGGAIVVTVDVANHRTLPPSSSFSAQFDVDASPGTGNAEGARGARRVRALERISIDVDDDPAMGDSGADLGITSRGTDVVVDRRSERSRSWVPEVDDPQVRAGVIGPIVTVGVHRSELGACQHDGDEVGRDSHAIRIGSVRRESRQEEARPSKPSMSEAGSRTEHRPFGKDVRPCRAMLACVRDVVIRWNYVVRLGDERERRVHGASVEGGMAGVLGAAFRNSG